MPIGMSHGLNPGLYVSDPGLPTLSFKVSSEEVMTLPTLERPRV